MKQAPAGPPQIGPFRIIARCAKAATGPVYLGLPTQTTAPVGLALIHHLTAPDLAAPAFAAQLSRSIDRALRLRHPSIAAPYCVGEYANFPFVASEYVPGQAWSDARARLWATGGLRRSSHVQVLVEVLAALEQAHAADVVHAGVGSSCVFFGYDGRVKLGAFGLGAALAELECEGHLRSDPVYRPPEQLGGQFDHRADLYAVGVMLWEALARAPAYRVGGQLPPIGRVVSDVEPSLMQVCDRALANDPAARFQNASDFRRALISHRLSKPVRRSVATLPQFVRGPVSVGPAAPSSTALLAQASEMRRGPPPLPPAARLIKQPGTGLGPASMLPAPERVNERATTVVRLRAVSIQEPLDATLDLKAASELLCEAFGRERQQLNELLASVHAKKDDAIGAGARGEDANLNYRAFPGLRRAVMSRAVHAALAAGLVAAVFWAGWSLRSAALDRTERLQQQPGSEVATMPRESRFVRGVPSTNREPRRISNSEALTRTQHHARDGEGTLDLHSDMPGHPKLPPSPVDTRSAPAADAPVPRDSAPAGIEVTPIDAREPHDRARQPESAPDLEFDAHLPHRRHKLRAIDEQDPYR